MPPRASPSMAYVPPAADRPPFNWTMVSVIMAVALNAATGIWWASAMSRRVTGLERSFEPLASGVLARLDERTEIMDGRLKRIEGQLDASNGDR